MLRRLAERMSRNIIFRRKWPEDLGGGHIYVTPAASLCVWKRRAAALDPELLQAARILVRPGGSVWDLGANLGLFTFTAAHLAGPTGKVLAVEADTWMVALLRRSLLGRTGGAEVRIVPAAITGEEGIVSFHIAVRGRSSNFIEGTGRPVSGGSRESQHMLGMTLDWLLEHTFRPDTVKIDIEGAEIAALSNAPRLLREARPRIYVEIDPSSFGEATQLFKDYDYAMFEIRNGSPVPIESAAWNTLAVPQEQQAAFTARASEHSTAP